MSDEYFPHIQSKEEDSLDIRAIAGFDDGDLVVSKDELVDIIQTLKHNSNNIDIRNDDD